jgi:hypothetical protein
VGFHPTKYKAANGFIFFGFRTYLCNHTYLWV